MSSVRLRAVSDFLKLILNTTVEQARCLLSTATLKQIEALCEIAFNLINSITSLPAKIRRIVTKHKKLLQKLCKKRLVVKTKIRLIKSNLRAMLTILKSVKDSILKLV